MRLLYYAMLFIFFSSAVQADWRSTRWSMKVADLLSIAELGAIEMNETERRGYNIRECGNALAKSFYKSKDFSFEVSYHFQEERLKCIKLDLLDKSKGQILAEQLRLVYGNPVRRNKIDLTKYCQFIFDEWHDDKSKNKVILQSSICSESAPSGSLRNSFGLLYEPLSSGDKDIGL
jgi:hypothetical protein